MNARNLAVFALASAATAHAQPGESIEEYPSRPLRMIIPFAPGGASDFVGPCKLFAVVKKVVHDPWVGAQYEKASAQQTTSNSLEEFAAFMKEQNAFWAKIIKDVDIKTQ